MVLVFHVILENYALKRSWVLWMGAPMLSHHPAKLSGHTAYARRGALLICHLISQNHVTQVM